MTETVRRNYEYRLYPRAAQARALDRQLHLANDLWNAALKQRIRLWRDHHHTIGFTAQSAQLTEARRELAWLRGMNALAQHEVLRRLDKAMHAFFRRLRAGETPGFPRFHRFDPYGGSITWAQHGNGCRAEHGQRLYLQGVGNVKMRWHRPLPEHARVTQVTVRRRAGRWHAVLCLEIPPRLSRRWTASRMRGCPCRSRPRGRWGPARPARPMAQGVATVSDGGRDRDGRRQAHARYQPGEVATVSNGGRDRDAPHLEQRPDGKPAEADRGQLAARGAPCSARNAVARARVAREGGGALA